MEKKRKDQAKYGSIKRFFPSTPSTSTPSASTPSASTPEASTPAASTPAASTSEVKLITAERDALQLWQKRHASELKSERSRRVAALILLLNLDLYSTKNGLRHGWMVSNSIAAAASCGRSARWAESLHL